MKGKPVQILLVVTIFALALVFSACLQTAHVAEVRLLSSDLTFENPDQDDIFFYQPGQSKASVSTLFTANSLPRIVPFDRTACLWLSAFYLDQEAVPLRC